MHFVGQAEAANLTELWVAERILFLLDGIRQEDAQCIAEEWGLDWPEHLYDDPLA
tara:strand:+ start:365 stop:529 length:165 start_codon:yes stop_codon:yes gene_type:complete